VAVVAMRNICKAGALYFALVFSAGFALGTMRVLVLVPRLGVRAAELLELPLMLAVSFLSARWVVRRMRVSCGVHARLRVGGLALALLLAAEFTLVLGLQGLSLGEYLASRDPLSGAAYYIALVLFGLMPLLISRKQQP
jgi:hypothetical protein